MDMHIKKDLKNNIEKFNSNQLEKKTNFFIMKKFISNYRFQSKQNFLLKPINFKTVLTFLPFALGVAEFIYKKYTPQKPNIFFQKTLPAFTFLNSKINFETLEYVSKSNFLTTGQKNLEELVIENDFWQLGRENPDKTFFFGHPNFIARLKKPQIFSRKKFNGLLCNFDTANFADSFYKNLDELPSYLKGLSPINETNRLERKINLKQKLTFLRQIESAEAQKLALFPNLSVKDDSLTPASISKELFKSNNKLIRTSDQVFKTPLVSIKKNNFSVPTDFFKQPHNNNLFCLTPSIVEKKLTLVNDCNKKFTSFSFYLVKPTTKFSKNRHLFYKNLFQLNTELHNLFLSKNLCYLPNIEPNSNVNLYEKDEKFLKNFFNEISYKKNGLTQIDETFLLEKILQKFSKKNLSGDFPGFRLMSGYKYPDMNNPDLYWFSIQNSLLGKWARFVLKCDNSSFLSSSKNYTFTIKTLPTVLIETRKLLLKNFDNNRIFYNGPTLLFDSKKALDWRSHGEETLRSWFNSYLSPSNPLIQSRNNFFGVYYSPEFALLSTDKNQLEPKMKVLVQSPTADFTDFTKKSFFSLKYNFGEAKWYPVIASLKNNFAPFNYSLHIPSQINNVSTSLLKNRLVQGSSVTSEEKNFFIRGVDLSFSNIEDQKNTEYFLPVVQLQQPRFTRLSANSNMFQLSSPFFETGLLGKVDYTLPTECFDKKGFVTKSFSGHYKKISSLFSTTKKPSFLLIDNWEPLTSHSWLIVSQLSFAVFIFQILKALADNYGRELLGYLLDLVSALGVLDDSLKQEIEILMGQREKGFRIILKSKKNFTAIAGIRKLLPEIYELVWFLRNSARDFALSKTLPRGVLLAGPPGTGKTLLVQALAGEAQVPVLVLSGSSLIEPGESGALKLEMLFQEARQLAPCIVFIDEMDTLAQKRSGVVQNPMGPDELLESLTSFESPRSHSPLEFNSRFQQKQKFDSQIENSLQSEPKQEQLTLLMQFLIELDGIQGRDGVIVIGATNRPEVLDPAVLRPGRFDKILQVGLPGQEKRIEILKFYGQSLGYQSVIPWDYLGQRTAGFTAADLATLMNESSIKAILNQTVHTIETIEHGIDRITTSQSEKYIVLKTKSTNSSDTTKSTIPTDKTKIDSKVNIESQVSVLRQAQPPVLDFCSKVSLLRLAYYQAGKIVVSHVLETHPNVLVAYLWPRRTTIRSLQITTNLQNSVFQFARLVELNERIIASYAGKAAEFLFLEIFSKERVTTSTKTQIKPKPENVDIDKDIYDDKNLFLSTKSTQFFRPHYVNNFSNLSTLGLDDLLFAQKLIYCLIEKWSFYSKKLQIQKTISLLSNINIREFTENKEKIEFYNQFIETIETPPMTQALETHTSSLFSSKEKLVPNYNSQNYYSIPWWQQEISSELEFVEKNFANWSRIYLSNPEQSDRNPEWLPPDEFYHTSSGLKNVKKSLKNLSKRKYLKKTKINTNLSTTNLENKKQQVKTERESKKVNLTWNDIRKITRDYPVQSLVLQGFNKTLSILNQNREIVDRIVIELLYHEILREPELTQLFRDFENFNSSKNKKTHVDKKRVLISNRVISEENLKNKNQINLVDFEEDKNFKILESPWGIESRKKLPRWVDFGSFKY